MHPEARALPPWTMLMSCLSQLYASCMPDIAAGLDASFPMIVVSNDDAVDNLLCGAISLAAVG